MPGSGPYRAASLIVAGIHAGVAAGATVFGYSPVAAGRDAPDVLRAAGALIVFDDMAALPALLA